MPKSFHSFIISLDPVVVMDYFLLKGRLHPHLDVIFPSYKEILDTIELGKWHCFLGLKTKDPWSKCKAINSSCSCLGNFWIQTWICINNASRIYNSACMIIQMLRILVDPNYAMYVTKIFLSFKHFLTEFSPLIFIIIGLLFSSLWSFLSFFPTAVCSTLIVWRAPL